MAQLREKQERFFGREWVLAKLWHSLQNECRTDVLIVGGPGAGKTTLCSQIVSAKHCKHVLAHHFCDPTDARTLSSAQFVQGILNQLLSSTRIQGFQECLRTKDQEQDAADQHIEHQRQLIGRDPEAAFKKLIILPLLQIKKPKTNLLLVVDSVDETRLQIGEPPHKAGAGSLSKSIAQLLGDHCALLPPWLRLLCTARKQGKLPGPLSIFRKMSLDDQRKAQVVRDVQQFILSRLDQDYTLRQHINRETAEMLNQLRIKSNGCFLYLDKVLTGISGNFIVLREIKEIPGTLYGLYLWMSQRLFTKKQFSKVRSILSIILAAHKPLHRDDIFLVLHARNTLTNEDFTRRMYILRRLIATLPAPAKPAKDVNVVVDTDTTSAICLFHHSFAEWLSDVKYCTQRYLCNTAEGHSMLALAMASLAPSLDSDGVVELSYHLLRMAKPSLPAHMLSMFLLCSGTPVTTIGPAVGQDVDAQLVNLLQDCALTTTVAAATDDDGQNVVGDLCSQLEQCHLQDGRDDDGQNGGQQQHAAAEELNCVSENVLIETVDEPCEPQTKNVHKIMASLHDASNDGDLESLQYHICENADLQALDRHGRTALNIAARQGHEAIVAELLKEDMDIDHADDDGWTPLRSSSWAGHTPVVNLLLENGAQVDLTDSNGRSALRAAAWGGHDDVVASLLAAGACALKADVEGRTALIAAAYMGHAEIVAKLLNGGAELNHADSDGRTALSVAALCVAASPGHLEVVKMLLEWNVHVNHQDKDGATALLVAAFEGQREVCELLLEFEADVDLSDKAGRTPLWAAASMGHVAVAELLLFWGAYVDHIDAEGRTVLSVAAAQGNVGVVALLLARGLDEGHRDNAGWTPLHYAAFEGHDDVCGVLIEAGARLGDIDNDGKHALLLASQEGHLNVVEKLISYGCDLDLHSHDGRTSLRAAAIEGFKDIVQVICSRGGNLNYVDSEGRSTLYLLALECRLGMAHILIRHGADVETRDHEGRSPLHISAWQGHLEMVELLVSAGANVNASDKDNRTPLQSASWQGHANIVRLLCERGSDVDHVCNQGATALCIAAQEGYIECVRVLLEYGGDPRRSDFYGRTPTRVALKSGHTEISKLLGQVTAARNKAATSSDTTLDTIQCFDKPGAQDPQKLKLMPLQFHRTYDSPFDCLDVKPTTAESSDKTNSAGFSASQSGLSFTQQVQQISRHNYHRPKPRNSGAKSEANGHAIKSRKSDNVVKQRDRLSPTSPALRENYAEVHQPSQPAVTSGPTKSKSDISAHSFAFTRDSHMKIILGSSNDHPMSGSRGVGVGGGSVRNGGSMNGMSSATTAIRSGLIALKAGVMEAAAGRKLLQHSTTTPLVSAASLAVPHGKKAGAGAQGQQLSSNTSNTSNLDKYPGKKETQL